ncbi:hypothetical protein Q0F98_22795 [Paenibacillus amylolyticus]|nr:hypothetical protein Q0F98_22795 [Paenibacillus amylolyticus]
MVGQHLTVEDMQRFQQILQQQGRTDTGETANAYAATADQLGSSAEVGESVGETIQAKLHEAVREKAKQSVARVGKTARLV